MRAITGVDPVTGRKLSAAERIAAGAMAAAGFIPVVGWAGRLAKGGKAIYATVKGVTTASKALDAYKTAKGMQILGKAEKGIYGLISGNGLAEGITGKDMFGNQLTEEQRKNSLLTGFSILGLGGAAAAIDKYGYKIPKAKFPFSKEHIKLLQDQANAALNKVKNKVGDFKVPTRIHSEVLVTSTGQKVPVFSIEMTPLKNKYPGAFLLRREIMLNII
ncbi:pre-toxin TG domain-containing protein [Metabacillus sp. RGM 3146]|uniref:pre-toxin TG domain-containing protein n=1 Tax=Metabacillus sp. RGM 3146 TaxID=3401092 RepID=UPI003B9B50BE